MICFSRMAPPGIYVEIPIHGTLDEIWQKTQEPALHQRWDVRFTAISYLPRTSGEPHRFLYETRIGFGLAIAGAGESTGEKNSDAERTSALRFWSNDPKSLILEGSGYWKYLSGNPSVRFFTWYDYRTRFGLAGRVFDRLCFRPLIGWATAWSFDRLRIWIERRLSPENILRWTVLYAAVRISIILIWLWHGLVPKLLFPQADELALLTAGGVSGRWLPWFGAGEIAFALLGLFAWRWRAWFSMTALAMLAATVGVAFRSPRFLEHTFSPVTLNLAVAALSLAGWIAQPSAAFAGRCLRRPKETAS